MNSPTVSASSSSSSVHRRRAPVSRFQNESCSPQVGRYLPCASYVPSAVAGVSHRGYGFVVIPLIHPHFPDLDGSADEDNVRAKQRVNDGGVSLRSPASVEARSKPSVPRVYNPLPTFWTSPTMKALIAADVDEPLRLESLAEFEVAGSMSRLITCSGAFANSFQDLFGSDWAVLVVGEIPPWVDVDSKCSSLRRESQFALNHHLELASHLALNAVVIPLEGPRVANLAMELTSYLSSGPKQHLWIRVPMVAHQRNFHSSVHRLCPRCGHDVKRVDGDEDEDLCRHCGFHLRYRRDDGRAGDLGGDDVSNVPTETKEIVKSGPVLTGLCPRCLEEFCKLGARTNHSVSHSNGERCLSVRQKVSGHPSVKALDGERVRRVRGASFRRRRNTTVDSDGTTTAANDYDSIEAQVSDGTRDIDDSVDGRDCNGQGGAPEEKLRKEAEGDVALELPSSDEEDQLWFVRGSLLAATDERVLQDDDDPDDDPWEWYNRLRSLADFASQIAVCLVLPYHLPPPSICRRWLGEKVRCLIIPLSVFRRNYKGNPVLPMTHQVFIHKLMILGSQFVLAGHAATREEDLAYRRYIDYLYKSVPPFGNPSMEAVVPHFRDVLSVSAQPLVDRIGARVQATYEKDRTRYLLYYEAIKMAIEQKFRDGKTELAMMIVPAARGFLVKLAIKAAKAFDIRLKVLAVEPNENTAISLHLLFSGVPEVTVIDGGNDAAHANFKVDILVVDLLGSFGCDFLCPEIVNDAVQRFCFDDAIVIPQEYRSYLVPIQSSTLFNQVRLASDPTRSELPFETCYVTHMTNCCLMSEPLVAFEYLHYKPSCPERKTQGHPIVLSAAKLNSYRHLNWTVESASVCHGFAGFFSAVLFADKRLSTLPEHHSYNLISWFPAYIPIKSPVPLEKGARLSASFWRRSLPTKSWFEWAITRPRPTAIHNVGGRSHSFLMRQPIPSFPTSSASEFSMVNVGASVRNSMCVEQIPASSSSAAVERVSPLSRFSSTISSVDADLETTSIGVLGNPTRAVDARFAKEKKGGQVPSTLTTKCRQERPGGALDRGQLSLTKGRSGEDNGLGRGRRRQERKLSVAEE